MVGNYVSSNLEFIRLFSFCVGWLTSLCASSCDTANWCIYLSCAGASGDVAEIGPTFSFPPSSGLNTKFSDGYFTILKDDVYEYDELIMADFEFINETSETVYNFTQFLPNVTHILIKDDDGEYLLHVFISFYACQYA